MESNAWGQRERKKEDNIDEDSADGKVALDTSDGLRRRQAQYRDELLVLYQRIVGSYTYLYYWVMVTTIPLMHA